MKVYHSAISKIPGTDYREVYSRVYDFYKKIKARSKRRPYVRSLYFGKSKIFLGLYWSHLNQKNWRDRLRRLKFFPCAIDLIRHSTFEPVTIQNINNKSELLHRFEGITGDGEKFIVQIKEEKKSDHKWLLSVFPVDI